MSISFGCEISGVEEVQMALEEFSEVMYQRVVGKLNVWRGKVVEEAQLIVPVRTGYLRSTIYGFVVGWYVEIGAMASYAVFVERGTSRMVARPFLEPAVRMYLWNLEMIFSEAIDEAKGATGL